MHRGVEVLLRSCCSLIQCHCHGEDIVCSGSFLKLELMVKVSLSMAKMERNWVLSSENPTDPLSFTVHAPPDLIWAMMI